MTFKEAYNEAKEIAKENNLMVAVYGKIDKNFAAADYFNLVVSCMTGQQKDVIYIGKFVGNLPFEYAQELSRHFIEFLDVQGD